MSVRSSHADAGLAFLVSLLATLTGLGTQSVLTGETEPQRKSIRRDLRGLILQRLAAIIQNMNQAQREVLKNVERAANSAGHLAENGYHLTKDEGVRKIAEAVLALSQTVGVLARALAEETK